MKHEYKYKTNWISGLSPDQLAEYAKKVKDLYVEQNKQDEEIADILKMHPQAVFQLRKLMGLTRRVGDVRQDYRIVSFKKERNEFSLSGFPLRDVQADLLLIPGSNYRWRVKEAKKLELVLGFQEVK